MSYVEAYRSLGFNVEALGKDRANSAGKRANQLGLQNKLNRPKPTDYNGTIPMSQMKGLSDAEMLAYLQARCMYLEVEVDVLKKNVLNSYRRNYSDQRIRKTAEGAQKRNHLCVHGSV